MTACHGVELQRDTVTLLKVECSEVEHLAICSYYIRAVTPLSSSMLSLAVHRADMCGGNCLV